MNLQPWFGAQSMLMLAIVGGAACSGPKSHPVGAPDIEELGEDAREEANETAAEEAREEADELQGSSQDAPAQTKRLAAAGSGGCAAADGGCAPGAGGAGGASGEGGASGKASRGTAAGAGGHDGPSAAANGGTGAASAGAGASGSSSAGAGGAGGETAAAMPAFPALDLTMLEKPTQIPTGLKLTLAEGPLWDPCSHRLLFADVSASTLYALASDDTTTVLATDTLNTNGIAFDVDGSLILAQMGAPGHVARRDRAGTITAIDPPGPKLHTPDDVTVRSDGTIYFTDGEFPPVGSINLGALPVYQIAPGASMLQSGGTVAGPNGIELSPDETTLYVDAYFQGTVVAFAVAADGTLTKGKALASGLTNPDSLCLDAAGNLYVAVSSGLQVLRPDGTRVGVIPVRASQGVTNCAFGGDDGKTLYITAWTSIWKLPGMPIPGLDWSVSMQRARCD